MIHIVFQQSDVRLLKEAMKLDETLQGEVFEIKDEWGVGPLKDIDTEEGWNARLGLVERIACKVLLMERNWSEVLMTGKR